ncbi:MAG: transporter substrate-binding domain-containing protein [Desulfobacterales bacterium]|nr:transporter substrate-binding domain-containing protein [Desulfobacterales bacterium]
MQKNSLIAALLMVLFTCSPGFTAEPIKIATGEYAPYASEKGHGGGFVNHLIKAAFLEEGVQVTFKYMPWKRTLELTRKGEFAAVSYYFCTPERARDFLCSDSLYEDSYQFIALKESPMDDWQTLSDFKGKKIGATLSYGYVEAFYTEGKNGTYRLDVVKDDLTNLKKLLSGRIDYFPINVVVGNSLLRNEFPAGTIDKIKVLPRPLASSAATLMFPKSRQASETLLNTFNTGLNKLKSKGTYDQMFQDLLDGKYEN